MHNTHGKITLLILCFVLGLLSLTLVQAQTSLIFDITRQGTTNVYIADSRTNTSFYSGNLKFVVESAVNEANLAGGGSIIFAAGDFNLGTAYFNFTFIDDIVFAGQGIDVTTIRNATDVAADTEPFNCTNCDRLTIRDMTISAGGSARTTSDALDFDDGDNILIERIKVSRSRARGIVFDGKGANGHADGNIVRNCIIAGSIQQDGIQFLASSNNRVENCVITGVGRQGIYIAKASATAPQPNKTSNNNLIINNQVSNSGLSGIGILGGNQNVIRGNTSNNNGMSGIQITTSDSIRCDNNVVDLNIATGNSQYGLRIFGADCHFTTVGNNTFTSNALGPLFDSGTGTIYSAIPTPTYTATNRPVTQSITLNPVADSYVSSGSSGTNYGTNSTLRLDSSPIIRSYLRFNVPNVGTVVNARLQIYTSTASTVGYSLFSTSNSWDESTIKYSNAPALGTNLGASGNINSGTWTEINVTALVRGQGQYSFAMSTSSSTAISFSSREGSRAPRLIIDYASATPNTATPSRTPTNTPVPTAILNLLPIADTYVNAGSPTTIYGAAASLKTDAEPINRSYLMFNVPSFTGTIISANLRVYASSSNPMGYSLYRASNSWTEVTTNFSNAPALGSLLGSSGPITSGTWTQINVTAYITGAGQYSFVMHSSSTTATSFSSRTGTNPPQLIISLSQTQTTSILVESQNLLIIATDTPTTAPTASETATTMPSELPTLLPTELPTDIPTVIPTELPTELPMELPTDIPTAEVTEGV